LRRAFTFLELIITMVILSIVAYIASGLIVKTYISYNQTEAIHKANLKLEIALNSIANRLEYAIDGTVVKRKSKSENSIESISNAPLNYNVLEWIGYDKDGFEANNISASSSVDQSAWSGFCNIKTSSKNSVVTPGSDLSFANNIINRVSNANANFAIKNSVAIFFPGNYNYTNIGYSKLTFDTSGLALIKNYSNSKLILGNDIARVTEHYKLAWSAYAVLPINCVATKGCDLVLRFNFRPWLGEDYNRDFVVKNQKLLATNVIRFKTYATENRVHIKLCIKEQFGVGKNTSICKERVVSKWLN